jgi:hypothetical protein
MEISDVRRRVVDTIERARGRAADHRVRVERATTAYEAFLNRAAIPIVRQIANVLRAHSHAFEVFTPAGAVRLSAERAAGDYIELELDASADPPVVVGRVKRSRGRRVIETEDAIGDPAALGEEDVLTFFLKALEPFVER